MEKIGVFGGTFNPPHAGHLLAAEEVKKALGLDRILFVPDAWPPHKAMPEGSPAPEQRLEMVRAAVKGLDIAEVSDMELRRGGKSYTADTLRLLKAQYPEDRLYLITGTDMFLSLHNWYAPEEICRHAVIRGHEPCRGRPAGGIGAPEEKSGTAVWCAGRDCGKPVCGNLVHEGPATVDFGRCGEICAGVGA